MAKRPKKNRHLGQNAFALIQLILAGCAVLLITLSLKTFAPRLDLTTLKDYSLSDYTEKLLNSEKVQKSSIVITCLANHNSPYFSRIQTILNEYERLSSEKIRIVYCDPLNHPDQAYQVIEQYKLKPTEDLLILDKGTEKGTAVIPFSDLMLFQVTNQKQRTLSAYQVEDVLSTTLLNLIEEKFRKVYLVSDNTQANNVKIGSIGETLQALYRNQNIDLQPLILSGLNTIPEDASGLVFLTPQYDLEPEAMELLEAYWNTPKASLLFILEPDHNPKRLRSFMRKYGVTQRTDRICNLEKPELSTKTIASFTKGAELNDLLQGKSTLFDGVSSTLEVRESADDLINKRIVPLPLIKASETHYSESRHTDSPITFNDQEDLLKPLYLGAAVVKGNEMNDQAAASSSRMVILSTSEFLNQDAIRAEQIDFMKNAINWLVGRTELIGIGPKPLTRYKLNLISSEVSFMNRLTLFILPAFFLLIAAFVWNLKRS